MVKQKKKTTQKIFTIFATLYKIKTSNDSIA